MVRGRQQLDRLAAIPANVTEILVRAGGFRVPGMPFSENDEIDALVLSQLPPHVKKLVLKEIVLLGPVRVAEGLEELELLDVVIEGSLLQWIFPQSLRHFTLKAGQFSDLRAVTAPAITIMMKNTWPKGEPDMNRQFLLPESLAELTIDNGTGDRSTRMTFPELVDDRIYPDDYRTEDIDTADAMEARRMRDPLNRATSTVIVLLPPYLEQLNLVHSDPILEYGPSQLSMVKSLMVRASNSPINFEGLFPRLEHLELKEIGRMFNQAIDLPRLKSLSIDYRGARAVADQRGMEVDAPLLESLSLDRAETFPVSKEWPRLESLTIVEATLELPFMPHLQELELDQPQTTNGFEVRYLDEYKQAWGQATRKKRPQMAAEMGY